MSNPDPEIPRESVELPSEETKRQFIELTIAIALKGEYEDYSVELNDGRELVCGAGEERLGKELVAGATVCDKATIDQQGIEWAIFTFYDVTKDGKVVKRLIQEWISDGNTPPDLGLSAEEQAALDADLKAQADEAVIEAANYYLMTGEEKFSRLVDKWDAEKEAEEQMNAMMPVLEQELQEVVQLLREAYEKVKDLPDHKGKNREAEKILESREIPASMRDLEGIAAYAERVLYGYENRNPEEERQKEERVDLPDGEAINIVFDLLEKFSIEITELLQNKATSNTYLIRFEVDGIRGLKSTCQIEYGRVAEVIAGTTSPITKYDYHHLVELLQAALRQKYRN